MSVHLYLAPAGAGKTIYVLGLAREAAQGLAAGPCVCLPTTLQVRAWRRRLAEAGGAIGVQLWTFDHLYAECLRLAGQVYTELSEPVQYRLIRAIVDGMDLRHYAPLVDRPGFILVLQRLFAELKGARILPEAFREAVSGLGDEPRLRELAQVYAAYQERLHAYGWADRAGMGWLALAATRDDPAVAASWPLLVVDGFDSFTQVQMAMLEVLAGRVGDMVITLTGTAAATETYLACRRFNRTRQRLEERLGLVAEPLPMQGPPTDAVLAHLEAHLFRGEGPRLAAGDSVEMVEAPDRAAEVRAALRWLKARLLEDGMRPDEVALLARDIPPYRPFIRQVAAEFGVPIHLADGLPLRENPAVAALLDLLRLMLPRSGGDAGPALSRRLVVEAWHSPYFDWSALPADGAVSPIGIAPGDADALDAVARWGRVIAGQAQWEEVLVALARRSLEESDDEERGRPVEVPAGPAARTLLDKLRHFVQRLTPPPQARTYRDFVGWLESLIGSDPAVDTSRYPLPEEPTSLRVVARARAAAGEVAGLDVAALQALKDVLRGLVWAEDAVWGGRPVDFPRFFAELTGAIEASAYFPPPRLDRGAVLVANVIQARGVPFRAVAVLGLAEGEFPAILEEDPFLRDTDRGALSGRYGLPLEPSAESAEAEFFYETVTRAWQRLLLTRPRLADNGAPWQASPYWEEVLRLVDAEPVQMVSESVPPPERAASWGELMESLVRYPGYGEVRAWAREADPGRQAAVQAAARVLAARGAGSAAGPFEGDLSDLAGVFGARFGPDHTWSASRLENYRTCPFLFFVANVLGLEPREEPVEGLDARQLGNIYHRIFEELYQAPGVTDPGDLDQLLAALPAVAARVLDQAPRREGFRETAWWAQSRREIEDNVRRSLEAMAAIQGSFVPYSYELTFGLEKQPPLVVKEGGDSLRLRGYIDRVDRSPEGWLRIIDYKTSGPSNFTSRAVADGKKLQLPLYALAARDALKLGEIADGYYWHVRHARRSDFSLGGFKDGPQAALKVSVEKAWEAVKQIRVGAFGPRPPQGGCPSYCPAVAFCWRYRAGYAT